MLFGIYSGCVVSLLLFVDCVVVLGVCGCVLLVCCLMVVLAIGDCVLCVVCVLLLVVRCWLPLVCCSIVVCCGLVFEGCCVSLFCLFVVRLFAWSLLVVCFRQ